MSRCPIALLLAALPATVATGANAFSSPPTNPPVASPAFPVGEELIYRIYWGRLPVAIARATTQWVEEDGRRLIAIRFRTRSSRLIATIYPVDDFVESVVDPETFLPIRFTKNLSEGRYRVEETTTFDHARLTAHWESRLKKKQKDFPIESDTRDIVSFMYHLRSQPFPPGEKRSYRVMADEKIYDLHISIGYPAPISLPRFGPVRSIRIDPEAAFEGFFVRTGKAAIWVSDDERRLCTQLIGSVPVATIRVLLSEVRGPGDDVWVKGARRDSAEEEASGHGARPEETEARETDP